MHVDDIFVAGSQEWIADFEKKLTDEYEDPKRQELPLTYCGIEVSMDADGTVVCDQKSKISKLEKLPSKSKVGVEGRLSEEEVTAARSAAGKLAYIAHATRPDLCQAVAAVQSSVGRNEVGERVNNDINKLVDAAKEWADTITLKYKPAKQRMAIVVYCDAALEPGRDGIIVLRAPEECCEMLTQQDAQINTKDKKDHVAHPIEWWSRRAKRESSSSLVSELGALERAMDEVRYTSDLILHMTGERPRAMVLTDNKTAATTATRSTKPQHKVALRSVRVVRDTLQDKALKVGIKWIPKEMQLANPLTKADSNEALLSILMHGAW